MLHTFLIILNLIILEGLLSVDNAAVLALIVKKLPENQQKKALKWGIWGAYILRGVCLAIASWLASFMWLKIFGGLFLLRLAYTHFTKEADSPEEVKDAEQSKLFKWFNKGFTFTWKGKTYNPHLNYLASTIIVVEWMDLVFSMDNVFAAVALSDKLWVVIVGVCIGIACMRFIAGKFLDVMKKYPSLENSAFIVIGILGLKLAVDGAAHYILPVVSEFMAQHWFDLVFSGIMMIVFFYPIVFSKKVVETPIADAYDEAASIYEEKEIATNV